MSIAELECADDIVGESYECTFNDLSTHPLRPDELRRQVIENNLPRFDTIVVLGGRNYSDRIKMAFSGKKIVTHLAGITGIGYMIQELGNAIKNGTPLGERLSDQNYFPFFILRSCCQFVNQSIRTRTGSSDRTAPLALYGRFSALMGKESCQTRIEPVLMTHVTRHAVNYHLPSSLAGSSAKFEKIHSICN